MIKKQKYFQQVEKMLYDYKYLDQAIANLEAELEAIMPQTSTSLIKVGQGSTRTLFDTSQTERWGIKRAESRLREKLLEKRRHKKAIKEIREQLTDEENTFIWLRYDLEKTHDALGSKTWRSMADGGLLRVLLRTSSISQSLEVTAMYTVSISPRGNRKKADSHIAKRCAAGQGPGCVCVPRGWVWSLPVIVIGSEVLVGFNQVKLREILRRDKQSGKN